MEYRADGGFVCVCVSVLDREGEMDGIDTLGAAYLSRVDLSYGLAKFSLLSR